VILADEPTASLDAKAGAVVIDILLQLSARDGRTVIAISHDQELLKRFSTIVALDHGRVTGQQKQAVS
jgi:putative ABC transport system ATP-binding protein